MKRWMIYLLAAVAVFSASYGYTQDKNGTAVSKAISSNGARLDLTAIKIEDPAVRKALKSDLLRIRLQKTDYLPQGKLPVLKLEAVDDAVCRRRLLDLMHRHEGPNASEKDVKAAAGIYMVKTGALSFWISRASGGYKFTDANLSMATPTKLTGFKQAVQIALQYIAANKLVDLVEGEEVDLLFVSEVKNALTGAKDEKPLKEFVSDYYIGFGRRFNGVPVIGSQIVLRLNGKGEVVMEEKNWRRIVGVGDSMATISLKPIPELIAENPDFRQRRSKKDIPAERIGVVDIRAGYMEAPVNYRQETLRPGCSVSYQLKGAATEGLYPQLILPLEEGIGVERLWGRKVIQLK